jgi:serine/threonine protein kinase
MNVDIQIGNQLYGKFGKKFHEAKWISKENSSIILLLMDEQIARKEVPFYLKFNSHSHIVRTFGLVKNNFQTTVLVQERALHGNLQLLLQNNQLQPSGSVLIKIFLQIIDAMIYMIDKMVIYGDLRCENVLVFQMNPLKPEENLVKLTNFNLARHIDPSLLDKRQTMIPIRYCAPEILQNIDQSNYSELSDVYSMGVLMWEACSKGEIPYGSDRSDDDVRQCRLNNERLSKPDECDNQIWAVIQYCLYTQPELRYKFREMQQLLSNICIT